MPIYGYKCKKCLNSFEVYKPMNKKDDKEKCPICESYETDRLLSQFSSNSNICNISYSSGG